MIRVRSTVLVGGVAFLMATACGGENPLVALQESAARATWTATGSMAGERYSHRATLLGGGKVLVEGGADISHYWPYPSFEVGTSELYDPASGTWTSTGSMANVRATFTATLLPDGKVLVAGGTNGSTNLSSAELYDPASGTWTATGSMTTARVAHTATLVQGTGTPLDGKVLVAGGEDSNWTLVASAEIYDPASGTWTPTGSMASARYWHAAVLLQNKKILVVGGDNVGTAAEFYDPASGGWTPTGSMNVGRSMFPATLLPSGKVLVAGGCSAASAELYDPALGAWTTTGSIAHPRFFHTATLLTDGTVLVSGGSDPLNGNLPEYTAEVYSPKKGTWSSAPSMIAARAGHTATLLQSGKVLVAGGNGVTGSPASVVSSAELYSY